MELRKCGIKDIELLTIYNKQLIEDENSVIFCYWEIRFYMRRVKR